MRFYKDPLFRRFVSGSLFAGLFVWVAVRYFHVDVEIVRVLFIFSLMFVACMVCVGFALSFVVKLFRRRKAGMLAGLDGIKPNREDE